MVTWNFVRKNIPWRTGASSGACLPRWLCWEGGRHLLLISVLKTVYLAKPQLSFITFLTGLDSNWFGFDISTVFPPIPRPRRHFVAQAEALLHCSCLRCKEREASGSKRTRLRIAWVWEEGGALCLDLCRHKLCDCTRAFLASDGLGRENCSFRNGRDAAGPSALPILPSLRPFLQSLTSAVLAAPVTCTMQHYWTLLPPYSLQPVTGTRWCLLCTAYTKQRLCLGSVSSFQAPTKW